MKKTVEEKAEIAKRKIDNKMQKQKQKEEKNAAKKEKNANKKAEKKEKNANKKAAKKEAKQQKKAAKQQISAEKKELKQQKKIAKREASQIKKQKKLEAKNKTKQTKAKQNTLEETDDQIVEDTKKGKKEKVKKEKKPKKEKKSKKEKDGEQQKTGGNKKVLFIALLALVFAGGGIVGFLRFRGGEKEENTDPYIEAYVLDDDFITSIPKFLEQSETRDLPEITVEENGQNKQIIYDYTDLSGASKEVKDYINYLTTENNFVPMFDFNTDAPAGYVSVATASNEEGKILKLDIDYTDTDYKVMISKTTENLPKPKSKENESNGTRDGALNYLTSFSSEELGLQKPVEEYKAIYDAGQSSIADHNCYGISLYELGRAGTNEFVGKFFVTTNQKNIFRYDPAMSTYTEIATSKKTETQQNETIEIAEGAENTENVENTENTENTDDKEEQEEDKKDKKDKKEDKHQKGRKSEGKELEEEEESTEKQLKEKQIKEKQG